MSGQRVRKSSPCSSAKPGPMRATIPLASVLRQGSSLRKSKSNSPTLSPTSAWKTRISPESSVSGQRSPGSLNYKAKSKTLNARSSHGFGGGNAIRRTASLDTIYLSGQWPRATDNYMYGGQLLRDRATQTDEWTSEQRKQCRQVDGSNAPLTDDAKVEKMFRQRLQRPNKDGSSSRERTAAFNLILQPHADNCPSLPSTGTNTPSLGVGKAVPVNIPQKPTVPRPPLRSSTEGLNQEIERLVLKAAGATLNNGREEDKTYPRTPEGHRAPLAEILRSTRSVNIHTQTPAGRDLTGSSQSSGHASCESVSPQTLTSRPPSDLRGGSRGSTPDQEVGRLGTSPHINKFLAREPPDGCEKISSKFLEDTRRPMSDVSKIEYCPLKPCLTLKPSLGSAFSPLQQSSRSRSASAINGQMSSGSSLDEEEEPLSLPLVPLSGGGAGGERGGADTVAPSPPLLTNHHHDDIAGN